MLIDTHCHLDIPAFDTDREEVIERARDASVCLFLNPAFDMASSRRAVALANSREDIFAAVGIHPNDLAGLSTESIEELKKLAGMKRVVAIGEIGLDYYWNTFPRETQIKGFEQQLELAVVLGLPVIIHCREAYDDTLDILKRRLNGSAVIMHSFAGTPRQATRALSLGFYLGIGGPLTFKNAVMLRSIVREAPLDHLILETDAPYLAPHPFRGKRNEPSYLVHTARMVAEVHEIVTEEVAYTTTVTAKMLFGLT
jgi:TatD DNase family protein